MHPARSIVAAMDTNLPDAPAALAAWLARRPGRRGSLAARLSVAESTVWRWAQRRSVPRPSIRRGIQSATRIPAGAWQVPA